MRIATDVGGTYTDLVVYDALAKRVEDQIRIAKVDTTPPAFENGLVSAIAKARVSLSEVEFFAHGSTVVINALLSRSGAKTGLITTRGFRDVLEIARANRPDLFNLNFRKPTPFIDRMLRCEITERLDCDGNVVEPIRLEEILPIVELFNREGVEAVAISFLHAYANPSHEDSLADELRRHLPHISIVTSHDVSREWREYERTSTAALCAYVHPVANRYLFSLQNKLAESGFNYRPYIMQSNGGITTVKAAAANPIVMVESGPASGILGAAALGRAIDETNLLTLDIGGTTAKCALVENGMPRLSTEYYIERTRTKPGYPIQTPVVEIVEIGNGGGSIAWVDEGGKLHVGPQSAGATPGPAAYGRGGTEPTTTDAQLFTGRIDADNFLGGELKPDMNNVRTAFHELAAKLGVEPLEAARGVIRVANSNMGNALKLISINRGLDPRNFKLVAFGGGGPMHAVALARELRIPEVIVPMNSSVFSALGMLMTDLRRDYVRTKVLPLSSAATNAICETFKDVALDIMTEFELEGIPNDRVVLEYFGDCRYEGQEHTVKVPMPPSQIADFGISDASDAFHRTHEKTYSYRLDVPVEIVNFHVVGTQTVSKPEMPTLPISSAPSEVAHRGQRLVDFDEFGQHLASVYERVALSRGSIVLGPAVIYEPATTLLVPPAWTAKVDHYGNLRVTPCEDGETPA